MDVRLQKKGAMVACGAAALALGLSGCSGAGFDGSGSKEAASAEQLAHACRRSVGRGSDGRPGRPRLQNRCATACTPARAREWTA